MSSTVDDLIALVASLEPHSYGEDVNALDHSLQTAADVHAHGGSDALVVAALLHDIGHVLGTAGDWGVADHAEVAARFLRPLLVDDVVEPIRWHVEAKRYLLTAEPEYAARLSHASVQTLAQQGGPMSGDEARSFVGRRFAQHAVALRRSDDAGKVEGRIVPALDQYRTMIEQQLRRDDQLSVATVDPT